MNEKYEFFYGGPFSQWYKTDIVDPDFPDIIFNCAEQYMMYNKAKLFLDWDMADEILKAKNPRDQKALGRKVLNFSMRAWDGVARDIVYEGNLLKFSQNAELKKLLLATEGRTLVEASPWDKIWGIGLSIKDAVNLDPKHWPGKNWLGIALTEVREELSMNGLCGPIDEAILVYDS